MLHSADFAFNENFGVKQQINDYMNLQNFNEYYNLSQFRIPHSYTNGRSDFECWIILTREKENVFTPNEKIVSFGLRLFG